MHLLVRGAITGCDPTGGVHLLFFGAGVGAIGAGRCVSASATWIFPVDVDAINRDLEADVKLVREIVSMGSALRERHKLKTRQPLRSVTVVHHNADKLKTAGVRLADLRAKGYGAQAMADVGDSRDDLLDAGDEFSAVAAGIGEGAARLMRTLQGHSDDVRALAVLPGGTLASGSEDNSIKLWDA